jgi:hypothetical protein
VNTDSVRSSSWSWLQVFECSGEKTFVIRLLTSLMIAQVEQLMDEVKQKKIREAAKQAAASYTSTSGAWISKGLVVKVMAEELADYYKRKGEVVAVVDQYVAQVEMLDSGDVLRIDQAQLETVRS